MEAALRLIQPMAEADWPQGQSMERQLLWCRNFLCGEPNEPLPGPFSMGLMATREFDMYGSEPELAALIYGIQREMEARLGNAAAQNPPSPASGMPAGIWWTREE